MIVGSENEDEDKERTVDVRTDVAVAAAVGVDVDVKGNVHVNGLHNRFESDIDLIILNYASFHFVKSKLLCFIYWK